MREAYRLGVGSGRKGEQFVGSIDGSDLRDEVSRFGERVVVDHQAASDGAGDFSADRGDAADILRAVIVGDEIDELSVWREAGNRDHAVESQSEDLGFAAGGRRNGKVFGGVIEEVRIELRDVGDPLAVRGPSRGAIRARVCGDLSEMGPLV